MRFFLPIILSVFVLFCFILPDVHANSEFFVSNTKGSYNLGCELDNSCFEPYIVNILAGDTVTWTNNDYAIHVVVSGAPNQESFENLDDGKKNDPAYFGQDVYNHVNLILQNLGIKNESRE